MKRILFFLLLSTIAFPLEIDAQVKKSTDVYVKPYTRKDGVKVKGHYRTAPNYTNRDNFSTKGNVNPYTGKKGSVNPDNNRLNRSNISNYNSDDYMYNNYYSYGETGISGISIGTLNFFDSENTSYSGLLTNIKTDIYLPSYTLGLGYSFGETSYSHQKASLNDFKPGQPIETETFWMYAGLRTFKNLYFRVGLGFRNETFDEELYNDAFYSENQVSAGLSYPLWIGGMQIIPEINFIKQETSNSLGLSSIGINFIIF